MSGEAIDQFIDEFHRVETNERINELLRDTYEVLEEI